MLRLWAAWVGLGEALQWAVEVFQTGGLEACPPRLDKMNHFVQRLGTSSNGATSNPCFSPYFGQNGPGSDRMAAAQVEPPFERQFCLRAEGPVVAETSRGHNLENLHHKRKISRHARAIRGRGTPSWRSSPARRALQHPRATPAAGRRRRSSRRAPSRTCRAGDARRAPRAPCRRHPARPDPGAASPCAGRRRAPGASSG